MANELERLVAQVAALPIDQQRRFRELLEAHASRPPAPSPEDGFKQRLLRSGLLCEIKRPVQPASPPRFRSLSSREMRRPQSSPNRPSDPNRPSRQKCTDPNRPGEHVYEVADAGVLVHNSYADLLHKAGVAVPDALKDIADVLNKGEKYRYGS